jgi:hypothetical protein
MTKDQEAVALEQERRIRKEAGLQIDPETAEVMWQYIQMMDPYGVNPDLPEECQQIGRGYFARSPGSDVWVCFRDLPDATRNASWEKHKAKLAFPAGLEGLWETSVPEPSRFLVEVPDQFTVARWSRDADLATICRCILGTLRSNRTLPMSRYCAARSRL